MDKKISRLLFSSRHVRVWIVSVLIAVAVFVCIVCNLAVSHSMTWMVYPVCSLLFAWGLTMPVIYYKKDGVKFSLGILTACILPFLLIAEQWSGVVGWFIPMAVPICLVSLVYIWIMYFIFRRRRNPVYVTAAVIFLSGLLCLLIDIVLKACDVYAFPTGWLVFGITSLVTLLIVATKIILSVSKNGD